MAKITRIEDGVIVGKEPSPQVMIFKFAELPVHDLDSLADAVMHMAERGAIVVRGKPQKPTGRRAIYDDAEKGPAGLKIIPRRWVAFDWDSLPLEPQSEPQPDYIAFDQAEFANWSLPDPLLDPEIGARIGLRRLPPAFRDVSCLWQVSAGAGLTPTFRLRTWHWLDHAVTGAEVKTWLKPAIDRKMVDPVTLVEAQPHYLAVRVVGGEDPCPRRLGVLRLSRSEVPVPDIQGIKRRQDERERGSPPEQRHIPRDPEERKDEPQRRIGSCIEAVSRAPHGTKHPTYKAEAARAKAICDNYGIEWAPVRRDLMAIYESTLTATEADKRRKSSTLGVMTWLEARG